MKFNATLDLNMSSSQSYCLKKALIFNFPICFPRVELLVVFCFAYLAFYGWKVKKILIKQGVNDSTNTQALNH